MSRGNRGRAEEARKIVEAPPRRIPRKAALAINLGLVLLPLLLLGALEGALRLAGHGYATGFFVRVPGREGWAPNQKYGWRFFPKGDARTPVPSVLTDGPHEGDFRIFVLGESAAMGDPDPAFGFSRILEVMLEARHPGRAFEVINTGMTAINSHVILPIAVDCARRRPDLFVVYMGNNEVVGPYGAGTVLDAYRSSRALIRAGIAARSTRTGQLVESLVERILPGTGAAPEWRGMETFLGHLVAPGDPRMEGVYEHFEANLRGILDAARRAGAGAVVSTVAVNLRDNPPFASARRKDLSGADAERWERLFREGAEMERAGRPDAAAARYTEALGIDDRHAEAHYRLARSLEAVGRSAEAKEHYARSRDLDALRFRADSRINAILREVAGGSGSEARAPASGEKTAAVPMRASGGRPGVILVDAERAFEESSLSPGGVPGEDLVFDHVHFTFEGNHLLARTILDGVEALLPAEMRASATGGVPSLEAAAGALTLTEWNRGRLDSQALRIVERPPFTAQADHEERIARWRRRERASAAAGASAGAIEASVRAHRAALARSPEDLLLRESFARLLRAAGDGEASAAQWRDLLERLPGTVAWIEELGHVLLSTGRHAEAQAAYREALRIWPERALTHGNLALALEQQGRTEEALGEYREATRLDPSLVAPRLNLAQALAEQGRVDEAIGELREAVAREPAHLAARLSLADALAGAGRSQEAVEQYRAAVDLRPDLAEARLRLARLLLSSGRAAEASALLEEAASADPGSAEAQLGLAVVLRSGGRIEEAIRRYREALRLSPAWPQALNGLAWILATAQDRRWRNGAEALAIADQLCERTGCRSPVFLATLAAARAEAGQIPGAVEAARRALALARSAGDEETAREIEGHLARYESGRAL